MLTQGIKGSYKVLGTESWIILLGTRKMQLPCAYFALGNTVSIRVEQYYLHEGLGQFHCEIKYQEHTFSAMLSVFEPAEFDGNIGNLG